MSSWNFVLSLVEHEKSFIISRPGLYYRSWSLSSPPMAPYKEPPDTFLQVSFDEIICIEVSKGTPERRSHDKASKHDDEEQGTELRVQPWRIPTFTSNSWLLPSPTRRWFPTSAYIPWTYCTIHSLSHSFLCAHQITFRGTQWNAFSRSAKAI